MILKNVLLAPIVGMVGLLALGFGLDVFANAYVQLIFLYIFTNIILAISLNLVNGFTGQFSLGHAGFMGVGAYVSAYLSLQFGAAFYMFPVYAIAGGTVAAAAGYMVGLPSLRLRGDYLAIVTLGFSEIIRVILLNTEAVGGARGMIGIPRAAAVGPLSDFMSNYFWSAFWVVVTFVVHWRLVRSTHGRGFLSVREDEIAAEAMGINTTQTKVRAFVISSFFAGIAGALFAHAVQYLNPASFAFTKTVDVIIMVVLGGLGSLTGSVLAAAIVTVLPLLVLLPMQEALQHWLRDSYGVVFDVDLRMMVYSAILILFMILRPQGIFGTREITSFFKRAGKAREGSLT